MSSRTSVLTFRRRLQRPAGSRAVDDDTGVRIFLQTSFGLPHLANEKTRNSWIAQYGLLEGNETRCPKLDAIIKHKLLKEALDADHKLSRLQNFVLDVAGLLMTAFDKLVTEEYPDVDRVQQAVQLALRILGNTSGQFSQERRVKAIISRLNPDLKSFVEKEDFSKSPHSL